MRFPLFFLLILFAPFWKGALYAKLHENSEASSLSKKWPATKHETAEPTQRRFLTGDWNGIRQAAQDAGVGIYASYANDLLGNPVGGAHRGFANAGSLGINFSLDFQKIAKVKGLSFFSSFVVRHGNNLSKTKIGNQFPVAQLYGRETYTLNELYLRESFLDDRLIFKAGRLNGGNDFFVSTLYGNYVNNAFCGNPISIFFNTPFTAYPNATWGAYAYGSPTPNFRMKFACYNNYAAIFKDKNHGANFSFNNTNGLFLISEWSYLAMPEGLTGNYKVASYYVTGKTDRFQGGPERGNWGWYLLLDQMVYRDGLSNITPFGAFIFAPSPDKNRFPFFFTSGIVFNGIIPSRKQDSFCLGAAYGSYSKDLRQMQRQAHEPQEKAETVLEFNYWARVAPWISIVPDIQYIITPKGYSSIPNALVMGMQVVIVL